MSLIEVNCPACGAQITFKTGSSIVAVCEYCKSVVARGDRGVQDLGKIAELVETGSPLDVGLKGAYHGAAFELTGRAQLGHEAGGMWDEWYAAFADGKWGWLAEAQGRFYLTFRIDLPPEGAMPQFDDLELGQHIPSLPGSVPFVVAEKGAARPISAQGEIPYLLVPGQTYYYADLSGPHTEFATIDYSDETPAIFMGREVPLAELGFPESVKAPEREARHAAGVQLNCPQCGGPMALRAPDQTLRATCPNCGSILDVNQGRLEYFKALQQGKVTPIIPIGATGQICGGTYTMIGFMQRSVEFDGVRYYWEEYLLYNPQIGFRWLVRSDDTWNFVESVPPGGVKVGAKYAEFNGRHFRIYQDAVARIDYVGGEFYWKVEVGEVARAVDYVHPPYMLSCETSAYGAKTTSIKSIAGKRHHGQSGEVNWSLGLSVSRRDVEKGFGLSGLPKAAKPAPNEVFPHKQVYKYWAIMAGVVIILGLLIEVLAPRQTVFQQSYQLQPLASPAGTQVIFTDPFELKSGRNIEIAATAGVANTWLYIDGDFYDNSNGLDQSYELPVEYYFGSDSDGAWSEGSQNADVHLSALPSGNYVMRMEVSWEHWNTPMSLSVRVQQGVPRASQIFLALLLISIIPLFVLIKHYLFSVKRWEDSVYTPFKSS